MQRLIKYHRSYDVVSSNGVWETELTNYGHGETLECTPSTVASKEFIWVGCEANTAVTNCWSTRIARLYVLHNGDGMTLNREFNVELDNNVSNVVGDKSLSSAEIEGIKVYNSSVYMTLNFMKNAAGVKLEDHANGTPLIARSIPD